MFSSMFVRKLKERIKIRKVLLNKRKGKEQGKNEVMKLEFWSGGGGRGVGGGVLDTFKIVHEKPISESQLSRKANCLTISQVKY